MCSVSPRRRSRSPRYRRRSPARREYVACLNIFDSLY